MDPKTHDLLGQIIALLKGLADVLPQAHSFGGLLARLEQNHAALADAGATEAAASVPETRIETAPYYPPPASPPEAPAPNPDEPAVTA